ncbi:hypothetical protein P43SY_007913 [Pythium insidiosum]|uniref:Uncharacterized protein n=1 Tax=Pythium insidiosum TaxID=114742 RepID=A0AAD5LP87_PYTIN|nr:hypothetical protein P43SY_007913 [Pythium insidiosum]
MIYYDSSNLRDILLRWHGSALNGPAPLRALCMALFALAVAALNSYHRFVVPTRESTAFVDTLTVFNTFIGLTISFRLNSAFQHTAFVDTLTVFNTFIGLTISFRLNSAFQQWRAGVVAVGALSEAARGIVTSGCAYVSVPAQLLTEPMSKSQSTTGVPRIVMEKCTFFMELRRLVFLYIAIVFHDCRGRDGIEKMKDAAVLTESELLKGVEIGSEIGFYHGCFLLWDHMMKHDVHRDKISARASKSIVSFGVLLNAFELKNIVDEDIMHKLLSIRAKFKVITALLGLKGALVFNAEDVDAHKNMSF